MNYFQRLIPLVIGFMLLALSPLSLTLSNPSSPTAPLEIAPGVKTYLTAPSSNDPEQIVRDYLLANLAQYQLTEADVLEYVVTDRYVAHHTGVTHLYFRQKVHGLEIFGANLNAHVLPDGRILTINNQFLPYLNRTNINHQPQLTAVEATQAAALHLGLQLTSALQVTSNLGGPTQKTVLSNGGISQNPIPAQLVYTANNKGELALAWELIIYELHHPHWWQMQVSASNGQLLHLTDWVVSDQWGIASPTHSPHTAVNKAVNPANPFTTGGDGSTYRVYEIPVESPTHASPPAPADGRTLVDAPAHPLASPFGWHDTNGTAGAEFTTTQGNNVHAYTDTDGNNTPDPSSSPDGGPGLEFNFPLDLTQPPNSYRPAVVTNLFYWNNLLHNISFVYGFTEAAGNFQETNYTLAGLGSDYVQAEAQDGSGTNGGNFATPPDGQNPRMQMFVWTLSTPHRDGALDNGVVVHEHGHGISNRLTGGPTNVSCLNNAEQMGEGWSDWQSLVLTMKPGDTPTQARTIGTYILGQPPTGSGIRPVPYTTDMALNNYTYGDIITLPAPHGLGVVWASMLWEMNWGLIAEYGFEPNLFNWDSANWDNAGNTLAYYLVQEGLALQPCSPGFVDGRNAILTADQALTGGENACIIWATFAKRGLGFSASQGSSQSRTDGTEAFDIPATCQTPTAAVELSAPLTSQNSDAGQTITYTINITNTGEIDDVYNLSAASSESWAVAITPLTVTLNIDDSTAIEVEIVVPNAAAGGTVDTTTITAVSQTDPDVHDSVQLFTPVNHPEITFTPAELQATLSLTSTATHSLTIFNLGGSALEWSIVEEGGAQLGGCTAADLPWLTLSHTSGTTLRGESSEIEVTFNSSGYPAGEYTGQLCLDSNDPTLTTNTLPLTMTVVAEATYGLAVTADTTAITNTAGATITYTVWVTNTGNVNDTYTVELSGHSWDTEASPTSLTLTPGAMGELLMMVTVPMTATHGMTDTTLLIVSSQGDNTLSEMRQFTTSIIKVW